MYSLAIGTGMPLRTAIQEAILPIGWFVAAVVAGEVSRHRRANLTQVERRAAEAERTREEAALRRAEQERLRIARELHDSLTHSISVIKVQAGVAVHLARKRGEPVPDALLAIQSASGEAARELRETLVVLRADRAPAPGLDRLPDLVERARSTGLPVTLTVTGRRRPLPGEIERAAYRIVQEALTNITRHAGPADASVTVDYGPDELTAPVQVVIGDQRPRRGGRGGDVVGTNLIRRYLTDPAARRAKWCTVFPGCHTRLSNHDHQARDRCLWNFTPGYERELPQVVILRGHSTVDSPGPAAAPHLTPEVGSPAPRSVDPGSNPRKTHDYVLRNTDRVLSPTGVRLVLDGEPPGGGHDQTTEAGPGRAHDRHVGRRDLGGHRGCGEPADVGADGRECRRARGPARAARVGPYV